MDLEQLCEIFSEGCIPVMLIITTLIGQCVRGRNGHLLMIVIHVAMAGWIALNSNIPTADLLATGFSKSILLINAIGIVGHLLSLMDDKHLPSRKKWSQQNKETETT